MRINNKKKAEKKSFGFFLLISVHAAVSTAFVFGPNEMSDAGKKKGFSKLK